jgi:cytochrome c oxidase subunit 2
VKDLFSRGLLLVIVGLAAAGLAGCGVGAVASTSGPQLYRACVNCHGPEGAGSATIGAPRIAGLPHWYIALQLHRFQDGLRGKHPDDYDGLRMRAMSEQMMSAGEIDTVAEYVSHLSAPPNPATLPAPDVVVGTTVFPVCAGCHGTHGEGNQQVNAAPIGGMDDWYLARQLRKFQAGVRGKAAGDSVGPIMQAMSATIDPSKIDAVATYVHNLPK